MYRPLIVLILLLSISACTKNPQTGKKATFKNDSQIESIKFSVIKTYPHDTESFTEGFIFQNNELYESTGSPENFPQTRSVIGPVSFKTGKINKKIELDRNRYFGEGIVFFKDKLYQLTYQNRLGFIYDSRTFKQIGTFTYKNKEGWGMTTDGENIIMSDGTNVITYWNPDSLNVIKTLNITFNGSSALYMNELEYINGYIYSNIWTTSNIAKIDPRDGKIIGIIDLSSLYAKARKENPLSEATNGIAYDPAKDRIFVTGKFWPFIFQIKFPH
jgi:glutaminyl-peptide cyclotransferase